MKFRQLKLATLLAVVIASCSKPVTELNPIEDPVTVKSTDVNLVSLDKDAVEFYKDVAVLAEWYADHPASLQAELNKNKTRAYTDSTYNDFVAKLASIEVYDENDKLISFFDLDETARHTFLKEYVKLEASFLDGKFKFAGTEEIDDHIEMVNAAFDKTANSSPFSETFDFDAEAAKIGSNDPYAVIEKNIQLGLGTATPTALPNEGTNPTTEQAFFKTLSDLGILSSTVITFNPICFNNTPKNFIGKLKSELRKGRVLVSLPGGYMTGSPLAINATANKRVFDVGHVAVISKDASEIASDESLNDTYSISIGTNNVDNMHHEKIGPDWTSKHGMSYLLQPIKVSYRYKSKFGFVPWVERTQHDVDNSRTYQKITEVMGKPYCGWYEMLTAKWAAPNRFICSSSAWWAIKEAHGVNIGSIHKSTIFPAGVYESGEMRIVARSW
jgi:hypothetical protein